MTKNALLAFGITMLVLILLCSFTTIDCASINDGAMLQQNSEHTGYSSSAVKGSPVSVWNFSEQHHLSIAAIDNGVVFFTSYGSSQVNEIFAVNALTGQLLWRNIDNTLTNFFMHCPAVSDGIVYTGTNAYNASNGNLLFNFTTADASTPPTIANGMIYLGTNGSNFFSAGGVIALDSKTGQKKWSFIGAQGQFPYGEMVAYPPAVKGSIVYFSSGGGVYALNALNGELLWRDSSIDKGWGSLGCVSVGNGRVYDNVGGNLSCIGNSNWVVPVGSGNRFAAIANETVYINSYALDASSGRVIWNNNLSGLSSPVVVDGVVFYGDYWYSDEGSHGKYNKHGLLECNAATGEVIWNFTLPGFYDSQSGGYVTIANNLLFYSDETTIYAFNLTPTPPIQPQSNNISYNLIVGAIVVTVTALAVILVLKKRLKKC